MNVDTISLALALTAIPFALVSCYFGFQIGKHRTPQSLRYGYENPFTSFSVRVS